MRHKAREVPVARETSRPRESVGTRLGPYEIVALIGAGGMGKRFSVGSSVCSVSFFGRCIRVPF